MELKLKKFIDKKFLLYPKTEKIIEVREELYSIMLDRYNDCLHMGFDEESSYNNAIEMAFDYKSAVREVETGSSLSALKKKLIYAMSFSSLYFFLLVGIYLLVSVFFLKSFQNTWLILVGGIFIYLFYWAINTYQYARLFNFKILDRFGIAFIFASLVPLLYVFPSLFLAVIYQKYIWGWSWIIVLGIIFFYIVTDYLVNKKDFSVLGRDLILGVAGLIFTTILYFVLSLLFDLWSNAWVLYLVYPVVASLVYWFSKRIEDR